MGAEHALVAPDGRILWWSDYRCFPETEDLIACLDGLVADGLADAGDAFFAGRSWGGWLECLNEGLHPDRWRAVFARQRGAGVASAVQPDRSDARSPP